MTQPRRLDLIRLILSVLAFGGLLAMSFWILRPFIAPFIWAATIAVATWPVMKAIEARLWSRRSLAVTAMTVALLILFILPFVLAIATIVNHVDDIAGWAKVLANVNIPVAPEWVQKLPFVGEKTAQVWNELAAQGKGALVSKVAPYSGQLARWFAAEVGNFGLVGAQFLLTVVIAAILYATGETAAEGVRRFARRLDGERAEHILRLATGAVRGVALGVVLTAIIQSVAGGLGLWIAGIPFAGLLTAVMFMLAVAQIGAVPVLVVAVGWLFYDDQTGMALGLLVWTLIVGSMDNVIRPLLIKRGADLPLLLIFAGVIGGLVSLGLVGLFVGPVVLAVTYTMLAAWVNERAFPEDVAHDMVNAGSGGEPATTQPDAAVTVSPVPLPTPPQRAATDPEASPKT